MACLHKCNEFVHRHEPWKLAKNPDEKPWLDTIIHVTMETLRVSGILLQPVIPKMASKLLDRLGIEGTERHWENLECFKTCQGKTGGYYSKSLGKSEGVMFKKIKKVNSKR